MRVNTHAEEHFVEFGHSSPESQSQRRRTLLASTGEETFSLVPDTRRASVLAAMLGQLQNPEVPATAAAISYLTSRASATTPNGFADVSKWIFPESRDVINSERNRFNNLGALGKPYAWNGTIERTWSDAMVLDCSVASGEVRLTIRDWTGVQWRPAPVVVHRTPEQEALVQQSPEKYGLNLPYFPLTISGFGTRHDITMIRTRQGWLVAQDEYRESVIALGDTFPDSVAMPRVSNLIAIPTPQQFIAPEPSTPMHHPLGTAFDWVSAVNYGLAYADSRNPAYTDFWPDDCANFVSQCFIAGGYPTDTAWSPYTHAWSNSTGLRNWLLTSGRGIPSNQDAMGFADIISYDWTNDGISDHVAIVTGLPGPLVSSHSADLQNIPYKAVAHPGTTFLYTTTLTSY